MSLFIEAKCFDHVVCITFYKLGPKFVMALNIIILRSGSNLRLIETTVTHVFLNEQLGW